MAVQIGGLVDNKVIKVPTRLALMLLTACKQTQLTSNYNRRSNKIYTKSPLNFKNFDVATNERN